MQLFNNIWTPRSLVIIFLRFKGNEAEILALKYTTKKAAKDQIDPPKHFDSIDEVVAHFGKSAAYHLHVTGSGVLSRMADNLSNYQDDLVINGDPEDFIFSTYDDGVSLAASFFRRALIEKHLEVIEEKKVHLLGVSGGLSCLFMLNESIDFALDYQLVKEEGMLKSFQRLEEGKDKVLWEGKHLTADQLIAKVLFHRLQKGDEQFTSSQEEVHSAAQTNYRQFSQFRTYGLALLTVIFLALVINYFYQNQLNDKVAQLELDLSMSNDNLSLLDRLDQEKIRKEQLVMSAGVTSTRFLTYYLDEIGRTVPEKINLQELEMFPVEGKMKNKRKVEIDETAIRISGNTAGNEILDDWIERMDRFEWVKGIELINYMKTEGNRSDFILTITLTA